MPIVPKYERQIRSTGLNLPQNNFNAPDLSANFNNVFDQAKGAVKAIHSVQLEEKAKADKLSLMKAQNDYDSFLGEYLHNKDTGALTKKGESAFNLDDDFEVQHKAKIEEINKTLNNDEQKQSFNFYASDKKISSKNLIYGHIEKEKNDFSNTQATARVNLLQEQASQNPYSPKAIADSLKEQNKAIINLGQLNGLPQEKVDQLILEANSKTHRGVLNTYLNKGEDVIAQQYFNHVSKDMTSSDREMVQKSLEVTSTLGQSQRLTENIMGANLSQSESLKKARLIQDPKIQDMVVQRIKTRFDEDHEAKVYAQNDAFTELYNNVVHDKLDISNLDKEKLTSLPPSMQATILSMKDGQKESDLTKYQDWQFMANDSSQHKEFMRIDASEFVKHLTPTDAKHMIQLQADIRKGKFDSLEGQGYLSQKALVDQNLRELKIKDKVEQASFHKYINQKVEEWSTTNNKKPSKMPREELQKIIDEGLIEGEVKSGYLLKIDPNKRAYQVKTEELPNFVPDNEEDAAKLKNYKETVLLEQKVKQKLKDAGRPHSPQDVELVIKNIKKIAGKQ